MGWLHDSSSFTARIVRGTLDDFQRDVTRIAPADFSGWSDRSLDVCWAGHATVLINFFGLHILTDPALFDYVGAQFGLARIGRKRLVSSPLDPERLPRIDLVLLSHAHMDHLDLPSIRKIPSTAQIVTAHRTADILPARFQSAQELRWGEKTLIRTHSGDVEVECVPVKHWGARWKVDTYRGYGGYLLKRGGKTVLFGGDTAYTEAFGSLKDRKIDLAIMPIGSYGSGSGNHCTPEESVRMLDECRADFVVPVHHSTFPIGREPLEEPLERLEAAIRADRIALRQIGQTWRMG